MTPSGEQKREILDPHVFYCIQQLAGLFVIFPHEKLGPFADNAVIESRVVNARNLLIFFEQKTRKKKDVICKDFGFEPARIGIPNNVRGRFDKDISHLTYGRIWNYENDREWPYHQFVPPILERCVEFIDHLLKSNQVPSDQQQRWKELSRLARKVATQLRKNAT